MPSINLVFQLMGSTSSAFVCFVLPAAFGLRLNLREARGPWGRTCCLALLIGGATLGIVATTSTVLGLLAADEGGPPSPPEHDDAACANLKRQACAW